MILPKTTLTRIERGKFETLLENLLKSKFTGFAKIAFRKDELGIAEILFDSGKILAAEVTKMKSKRSLIGDDVMAELANLENVVVEIYALTAEEVRKIFEMNQSSGVRGKGFQISQTAEVRAEIKTETKSEVPKSQREVILKKYNSPPKEHEVDSLIENSLGDSEFYVDIDKERIMKKYGIRRPREEEIDEIIANALGESRIAEMVGEDFDTIKSDTIKILESKLGKLAKKAIDIVSSCKSMSELLQKADEIGRTLKSLVIFVPRKRVEEVIVEIEQKIGKRLG